MRNIDDVSIHSLNVNSFREISNIIKECPGLKSQIKSFHPSKSVILLAGLLTEPSLHANTIRLETMIHLITVFSKGKGQPNVRHIDSWLNKELAQTSAAYAEDPVEDVFVSNVMTEEGNFRIFNGVWESNDFYLQRLLNIIETLPNEPDVIALRCSIRAALRLSEEIAARRALSRFTLGGGLDKQKLRIPSWERLKLLSTAVSFSREDLSQLNILEKDLSPFILHPDKKNELHKQALGDSELERHPILQFQGHWFVILPTAIGIAVREYILTWMTDRGYGRSFDEHLVLEYRDFLHDTPLLGEPVPKKMLLPVNMLEGGSIFEFTVELDSGRFVQMIAVIDKIQNLDYSLMSHQKVISTMRDEIVRRVQAAQSSFRKESRFKQGLTIIVGCGYGREAVLQRPEEKEDWWVASISAPDFETLAWIPGASPLSLWKLVEHERFVRKSGISILNVNGLLNLYGWWAQTNFFMVPSELEFGKEPLKMYIPTDSLTQIRTRVRQQWDMHAMELPDGKFIRMRRYSADKYFPEDNNARYASPDEVTIGEFLGAWEGKKVLWWVKAEFEKTGLSRDTVFRVWDALNNWLEYAAPVFERIIKKTNESLLIIIDLNDAHQDQIDPIPEDLLGNYIVVSTDCERKTIRLSFKDPFFGAFRNPRNVAERRIIRGLTEGVLRIAGNSIGAEILDPMVNEIMPNDDARYLHFFEALHFRDYIRQFERPKGLLIDSSDEAKSKIGLGWTVQTPEEEKLFTSAEKSCFFLNSTVSALWERMRSRLHALNRVALIEYALRHIEGCEFQKKQWEDTIRAVLALRKDKISTKKIAGENISRCKASQLALRLIIEMAVCECPVETGYMVGELDVTPLMSDVLLLFHIGGCSDAIRKGVMDPEVQIAPSGDILTHAGFWKEIAEPFGRELQASELDYEADSYDHLFESFKPLPDVRGLLPDGFLTAFEAEFGLTVDALRGVRDTLSDLSIEKKKCVVIVRRDEILSFCRKSNFASSESAEIILERFALRPRQGWDQTPKGFRAKDWYPWRFGRQLSLIARPLVQLEEGNNPRYAISPGLIGEAITYTLRRYYEGAVELFDCQSSAMREWINEEINRRGHAFARKVFERMKTFGYEARLEIGINNLLNEKFEKDLGDIDVLAWKPDTSKVMAIECKDLRLSKTPNEMAEQLNRFAGRELQNGKRDELKKQIERCDLLRERSEVVARALGIEPKEISIKNIVCFSKPVPVKYVAKSFPDVTFVTFDKLPFGT